LSKSERFYCGERARVTTTVAPHADLAGSCPVSTIPLPFSVAVSPFPLAVAVSVHRCRCRCRWLVGVDDWLASYGTTATGK